MGKIQLVGIEVMARIGLLEEEQYAPQDLLVSLDLSYDFEILEHVPCKFGVLSLLKLLVDVRSKIVGDVV